MRIELAEDLTTRALAVCTPLLTRTDVPEHVRALSSPQVIGIEDRIHLLLGIQAFCGGTDAVLPPPINPSTDPGTEPGGCAGLDPGQRAALAALAGTRHLVVVEGAAGAGKTTTLAATRTALAAQGKQMMVVTPTLKAAQVAAAEIDAPAFSAAWLAHQWGWRWDEDGHWSCTRELPSDPAARLRRGDLLVVDEAGMLDQDTARALLEVADDAGARVAFIGDRHQLPAVGRGGVLDLVTEHAEPAATVCLDVVHRFADPDYAQLSVAMRSGVPVFDDLWARNQIRLYASDAERTHAVAGQAAEAILAGHTDRALMADTRENVTALNVAIRDRLVTAGLVKDTDSDVVINEAGERLGVGDRVTTRRNNTELGIANRQTWTITTLDSETVRLRNEKGATRDIPTWYARGWVELAYATTVYGAQGDTTAVGHLVMGQGTTAAAAYVGMTRGRYDNTAHLVAETPEQAQALWEGACSRERADLGVAHARLQALDDIDRYGPVPPARRRRDAHRRQQSTSRRGRPSRDTTDLVPSRRPSPSGPGIGF